jgi:hypothetical protein
LCTPRKKTRASEDGSQDEGQYDGKFLSAL